MTPKEAVGKARFIFDHVTAELQFLPWRVASRFGLTVLFLALTCQQPLRAADAAKSTSAEDFVLQKVQAGEVCDLNFCTSADKPRISAGFLANLLTRWPGTGTNKNELPRAVSIANATIYSNIDLANLEVPFEVELTNCRFEGEVNFSKAVFRRSLHLTGSTFLARTAFNAMVIGRSDWSGSLYIDSATFSSGFDLTDASIERNLFAGNAHFLSADIGPRFAKLYVHGDAHFEDALFAGAPVFTQAEIKHGFFASRAQFNHRDQAQFDDLIVGDDAGFTNCIFAGPVDFTDALINGDFQASGAQFQNLQIGAIFRSLKVIGSMLLSGAVFSGPADFTRANIGAGLDLANASFSLASTTNLFHEIKVDGDATFDGASFSGTVNFHAARIADELSFRQAHFHGRPVSAFFDHMSVSGPASIVRAEFAGEVSFERSVFSTLDLQGVIWSKELPKPWLHLDGLKYERISDGDDEHSWGSLVELLSYASYNANTYGDLESFYQRNGHPEYADNIFFAQKKRERTDKSLHASLGTKAWSGFLNVFVRYGRAPWMAFLWGLVIVLAGTIAFNEKHMEPQPKDESAKRGKTRHHHQAEAAGHQLKTEGHDPAYPVDKPPEEHAPDEQPTAHPLPGYNAFWYSLDLFAPVIDLEAATAWRPNKLEHRFLYHYSRLHRILGWVLVPIGAAAVTGIAK